MVEGEGQFSVRGGICDVFPPKYEMPIRIEYFGDEVDRIGSFDVISQRTIEMLDSFSITPTREIIIDSAAKGRVLGAIKEQIDKVKDAHIKEILEDELKLKALIASQLNEIKKKYGQPRRTQLIHADDVEVYVEDKTPENYNVRIYMTKEGYFKKITMQSLRGNDEQMLKENDELVFEADTENITDLVFITDKCQLYRAYRIWNKFP